MLNSMSESKSIKKTKLTPTQAKVVKAKIKAEMNDLPMIAVANEVYPNQTPEAARVSMVRQLQNATVQEKLEEVFAELGLTANTLAAVVTDAMTAKKVVQLEGDFYETDVADHSIRLKAAGMAAQWMGVGKNQEGGTTNLNFINVSKSDRSDYAV